MVVSSSTSSNVASGVVVSALTLRDGELLLLRRSTRETFLPGRWVLPAGKVNAGEELETAVLRELAEEAGLAGTVARASGTACFESVYRNRFTEWRQYNFEVHAPNGEVRLADGSHCDYQWVPVRARGLLMNLVDSFTMKVINQAFGDGK